MQHPIRREDVQAAVERWTEALLAESGSGTVSVTLEFNVKDRRFLGYRLGGVGSRKQLTEGSEGRTR